MKHLDDRWVTQTELARICGIDPAAINRQIKRGILHPRKDRMIHLGRSIDAFLAHLRRGSKAHLALSQRQGLDPDDIAQLTTPDPGGRPAAPRTEEQSQQELSLYEAKIKRENAEAGIAALKRAEMEGKSIQISAVEAVWAQSLSATREQILQLRARLAPLLAAETDPVKVDMMLGKELNSALELLANARLK